jgi:hypothetical protein
VRTFARQAAHGFTFAELLRRCRESAGTRDGGIGDPAVLRTVLNDEVRRAGSTSRQAATRSTASTPSSAKRCAGSTSDTARRSIRARTAQEKGSDRSVHQNGSPQSSLLRFGTRSRSRVLLTSIPSAASVSP